jgi:hypothetical protein
MVLLAVSEAFLWSLPQAPVFRCPRRLECKGSASETELRTSGFARAAINLLDAFST